MTVAELKSEIVKLGGTPKGKKADLEAQLESLLPLKPTADEVEAAPGLEAGEEVSIGDLYCWDNGGSADCISAQGHRIAVDEFGPVLGYRDRDGIFVRVTSQSKVHHVEPGNEGLEAALDAA